MLAGIISVVEDWSAGIISWFASTMKIVEGYSAGFIGRFASTTRNWRRPILDLTGHKLSSLWG